MVKLPRKAQLLLMSGSAFCCMVGGVVLWKHALAGDIYSASKDKKQKTVQAAKAPKTLEGKVFVVTGANSGIGRAITLELAHLKGRVYMACRDMRRCEEARQEIVLESNNKYVYCRECDLSSFSSVRRFVDSFLSKERRLDALINNAGVMEHPRQFSPDGVEMHLAVNTLGHFLLTDLLSGTLRASAPSRVVYLVSLDYRKGAINFDDLNGQASWSKTDAFNQSQLANMLLVKEFSERLGGKEGSKVSVSATYPGIVSSNIRRHMGVDKSILGTLVSNPLLWFMTKSPDKGAQTPLFLALDEEVFSRSNGRLFCKLKEIEVDSVAKDEGSAKRMFAVAKYWTGQAVTKEEVLKEVKDSS